MTTPGTDPVDGGNLRMIGKILAGSAVVLTGFALVSALGWMPLSEPAGRAAAIVFAATAACEFIVAFFFLMRYKA
jgi:hypothetical protein